MNQFKQSRIVIDIEAIYPPDWDGQKIAAIMQDYMNLNRFVVTGAVQVSLYPINTRVVQQALSLAHNLSDIRS